MLTVAPPATFSVASSTSALNVVQGATAASTITVTPKSGFTGAVTLSVSGLPAGVTVSFNPTSTKTTSVATFTAASGAAMGTTTVTVTGTYGTTSASLTLNLTVKAAPSFTLSATPASLSVLQGASGSSTIAVTPLNGFAGTPTLTVTGLPAGVTGAFTVSTLKLTVASSAAAGLSTLTVTGTSGALSAQVSIALTVVAPPSFRLSASAANVNVPEGGTGSTAITVTPQAGFNGTVVLTAAGLPSGVTASFSPVSTTAASTLTLTATLAAAAKASTFTINGTSGTLTSAVTITVTVTPPPDFGIALAPATLHVLQGGRGATAISLISLNGFAGNVTVSASALPAGVTASFTTANSGVLGVFTVAGTAVAATSSVNVTATSGSLTHIAVLTLTVVAPTAATAAVDLSPSYNVSGSAIDNLPFTSGGVPGCGRALLLRHACLERGQTVGGILINIRPMGLPDAVSGQTVTLPAGPFTSLKMLATGVNGNQTGQTFTVTYTDGTTTVFTQSMSDWFTPQTYAGETQAITMNYRDFSTGGTDGEVFHLYGYSFTLNSAKTVRSIALPKNRNVVALAITLVGSTVSAAAAQVDLSKAFSGVGITSDGKPFTGGLDGLGNAYSGTLLQNLSLGAADQSNVVSGVKSISVALPAGSYSTLVITATAVNGAQLSQPFKVAYSDGTSVTFTQSLSDWFTPNSYPGEVNALVMPYRNTANGTRDNRPFEVYQYTFSLIQQQDGEQCDFAIRLTLNVKVFAMKLNP